jgi:hypothetical protein
MIEEMFLSFVLSGPPARICRTDEPEGIVCFDSTTIEPNKAQPEIFRRTVIGSTDKSFFPVTDFKTEELGSVSTEEKFRQLAAQWSDETEFTSSTTRMIANPSYQAIIKLGWDVVPLMLQDLQNNHGYWYPALNAITGIRPFDRKYAGDTRRMTEAWLSWGRKKNLV